MTKAVAAGGEQNNSSAFAHRPAAVIKSLLRLDQVDVLGLATGGDDRQVGAFGLNLIKLLHLSAGGKMRLFQITGIGADNPLVGGQNRIEQQIAAQHPRRL